MENKYTSKIKKIRTELDKNINIINKCNKNYENILINSELAVKIRYFWKNNVEKYGNIFCIIRTKSLNSNSVNSSISDSDSSSDIEQFYNYYILCLKNNSYSQWTINSNNRFDIII